MIAFGLRLTLAGGREALARLALIVAAVALGVGMLLAIVAGINAVTTQNDRTAWLYTDGRATGSGDPLWWETRADFFRGRDLTRADVAATGPDSPVPPGVDRLPGPGEYYVSPALRDLIASTPAAELGDRFPGRPVGVLGEDAVASPDDLVALVGRTPAEMERLAGAEQVTAIGTSTPQADSGALKAILGIVAVGLLFPILIFVNSATRLAAARREQRFAAMRLVGATPRQISRIAAVESAAASVLGTVLGFGLYLVLRGPIAEVAFARAPSYPGDVALTAVDTVVVAVGVPLAAAASSLFTLRRVRISPLGVTHRVTPKPPRAWRIAPLVLGLSLLAWTVGRRPESTSGQTFVYLGGVALVMVGLIASGPWLTMVGARALARRSSRTSTLIASRRLADDPRAAFRSVSGLVLALFVTTVAIGIITSMVAERRTAGDPDTARMEVYLTGETAAPPAVDTVPGVLATAEFREAPGGGYRTLMSCADLAASPELGRCPAGAAVVEVASALLEPGRTWPASELSAAEFARRPLTGFLVRTDGSPAALERARTALEVGFPGYHHPPSTETDRSATFNRSMEGWSQVANVVVLVSLPVAGCSLAVGVVGGLLERRRPFSLLRLSGTPLAVLRRVVAFESTVPLLTVAAVAIGSGLLAAHLFLRSQLSISLRAPGTEYYLVVGVGLGVSLAVVASTLPLLRTLTGPASARNE
ncbi:FtsX-like permease family protein [Cryptosporangium japonicum]|uniref:ABC transporter permease n=1 Tax=Cryptosporangium japonicum TaxID=80872 RepID=A0ABN0VA83_9ACTN